MSTALPIQPSAGEFRRLSSDGKLVPIWCVIPADFETPLSTYWKLAHDADFSFLLESVTGGENLARFSFLGVNPKSVVRCKGRRVSVLMAGEWQESELSPNETPLDVLRRATVGREYCALEGLPRFTGGAVGMLAYDLVRFFERLPHGTKDDLGCDDLSMMICDTIVAFDHAKNQILVIAHATEDDNSYESAAETIASVVDRLRGGLPALPAVTPEEIRFESNVGREDYLESVKRTIGYIEAGDGVQMVLSQRFSSACSCHPLPIYRALRSLNPSPYMYLLRLGNCDIVGASPEVLVTLDGRRARVRPIAGTRKRGKNEADDARMAEELLADDKERAEHIMLVDLGRNDLGRVSVPGSVSVNQLMVIERYSHVMHIVSDVTGTICDNMDAFDLLRATFPAGTVSGAPKVRAMEIIEELEPTRRGLYAGAVGYFGFDGNMDTAIAIRTVLLKGGAAHVQAGAGIVYDSVPEREYEECVSKARAVIEAVEVAAGGQVG
ncbi:MAG: anthranilate synthase component I [Armatimonadetes bacterium]|nr:anthranilate synthase component I [Armatimonadota bacterium]NOG93653.1 anthranilate synthase component I [Armatimonadota bacterium]